MRELSVKEFIEEIIVKDIEALLSIDKHFLIFGLICAGIEFLGACFDDYDWHTPNLSELRFRKGLSFFPKEYSAFNSNKNKPDDFYSALRCGFLHVFLPGKELEVVNANEAGQKEWQHLQKIEIKQGDIRLVIIADTFFKDFKDACAKVIEEINSGNLSLKKLKKPLLHV